MKKFSTNRNKFLKEREDGQAYIHQFGHDASPYHPRHRQAKRQDEKIVLFVCPAKCAIHKLEIIVEMPSTPVNIIPWTILQNCMEYDTKSKRRSMRCQSRGAEQEEREGDEQ